MRQHYANCKALSKWAVFAVGLETLAISASGEKSKLKGLKAWDTEISTTKHLLLD